MEDPPAAEQRPALRKHCNPFTLDYNAVTYWYGRPAIRAAKQNITIHVLADSRLIRHLGEPGGLLNWAPMTSSGTSSNVDERLHRVAAAANDLVYDRKDATTYIEGAPHIKHASLRALYSKLLVQVFDAAAEHVQTPRILDLGSGEGSVTLAFLELGAKVTAVDISRRQCDDLLAKCSRHIDRLEVRCEDVGDVLKDKSQQYDIVATNSFLHHVPDYLGLIEQSLDLLAPGGQFFSFQDPMRYDSLGRFTYHFKNFSYLTWRLWRGDVIGGLKRRYRRSRGVYYEDLAEDHAEYHAMRNGVDQDAIRALVESRNFDCQIVPYFSTQSSLFQPIGAALGCKNLFGVVAKSREPVARRT